MSGTKKSPWVKRLLLLVVPASGLAYGGWYLHQPVAGFSAYRTAVVSRGELTQVVSASGTLSPVILVEVGSQISGNIKKLHADFNSPVTNGQLIAELDPATYEADLTTANGNLHNAKAALELAQINAERAKALQTVTSKADYDAAIATLHQAEANVEINEGVVKKAQTDLARCTIYAPVDGVIISRNVNVGQTVAANLYAPVLFVIANDLSKMQIEGTVSEADIGMVEEGQEVKFGVDAFPSQIFSGRVVQIRNAPNTNLNVITYPTIIAVTNLESKLRPGMTANVSILVAHRDDALKVPSAALRFRPPGVSKPEKRDSALASAGGSSKSSDKSASPDHKKNKHKSERTVYVVPGEGATKEPASVNGRASGLEPAQVKTGISDGAYTEVLAGLKEGDAVVLGVAAAEARSQSSFNPFVSRKRY